MNRKITITERLIRENPIIAGFCDIINQAIEENPNMSLAEFAYEIDKSNKEYEEIRLRKIVDAQLKEIFGGVK